MSIYTKLTDKFNSINNLGHLGSIAHWDSAAMMPEGGSAARADALAELAVLMHQKQTDSEIGELLSDVDANNLSSIEQASVREMKSQYRDATIINEDLVKAISIAGSKCENAWRSQRADNDWKGFAPNLKEVVKLSREVAGIRADELGLTNYDALMEQFEPGMRSEVVDTIFADVLSWLPEMISTISEKQKSDSYVKLSGTYAVEKQKELGLAIMGKLGFDFNHGRLDVSTHPFCGGVPTDVRITTRYDESDFTSALMGVIHETGHARYEQGLPTEIGHLPVGQARSMAIHESQSLFFEMQIGRSREFLENNLSLIQQLMNLDEATGSLDNMYSIYNRVSPGFIRVDADEVTYPIHIIMRYQIEKALINGEMEVDDIPDKWNESMSNYLGLSTKDNYTNGCMQDIHWTDGSFGYFPSYTLGAMCAAQFKATIAKKVPDFAASVRTGNLDPIFSQLDSMIWKQASIYETDELMTRATGETLNLNFFRQHLTERYL